ncbi:MAG: ABC transporter permease, partial [Bacteroidota bacterium]
LSGLLAGVVTTAIFGAGAIVRASEVRPSALLRQSVVPLRAASRAAMAGLGAALLGLYGVLAGLLIGSLVQGIGIVAFGTVGLVVLGGGMVLLLLALIRIPIGTYTGRLARRSLAHRPLRTAASLAALFTGVFAIALTAGILQSARSQIDTLRIAFGYESVLVAGTLADSSAVSTITSETRTGLQIRRVVSLPVSAIRADSAGVGRAALPAQEIEGRALGTPLVNASIESGRGLERAKEALAPRGSSLKPGDTAVVETSAGPEATFTIVGTYGPTPGGFLTRARGLIVPDTDLIGLGATSAAYLLPVPAPDVEPVAARLSERLPDAAVLTARAVNEYITRAYDGLFVLALALASLSIGGGIVLIANSVGLSLLERRTEWAVLKSIGYTSRRVLGLIASENAVLGLLAGAAGSGFAMLTAYLIGRALDAPLRVPPATAVTVALLCIALAALASLLAARGALNTRPGEALKG